MLTPEELSSAKWWADFWTRAEHWAFFAVVVTLAAEFIALKAGEPYKKKVDDQKDKLIASLNKQTADLEVKNKELEKQNLELVNGTASRQMLGDDMKKFTNGLKNLSGRKFIMRYTANNLESFEYAAQIFQCARDAGMLPSSNMPIPVVWPTWPVVGVRIVAQHKEERTSVTTILNAFLSIGDISAWNEDAPSSLGDVFLIDVGVNSRVGPQKIPTSYGPVKWTTTAPSQ